MYGSSYYKMEARRLLSKGYGAALIGTLIMLIPTYLLDLVTAFFPVTTAGALSVIAMSFVFGVLVTNIIQVGYYRFLMSYENDGDQYSGRIESLKRDYNLVISGFTKNFRNTLKVTFARELYMVGWILVGLAPLLILGGAVAFLSYTTKTVSELISLFSQVMMSPTQDMIGNLTMYISQNCPYLPVIVTLTFFLTVAAMIPAIMKNYEYAAIPAIMARYPDMDVPHAFLRTKDMMTGFKLRYFIIRLSFLLYIVLANAAMIMTGSYPVYVVIMLLFSPYMHMTYLRFFKERNDTVEYNISVYGPHMP